MDLSQFEGIIPYSDEETVEALHRVARNPALPAISKYLFPDRPLGWLKKMLQSAGGIDEFQEVVMTQVIRAILAKTSSGLSFSGVENLKSLEGKKFLLFSNHRDIILDPAITQIMLDENGFPMTEICVGSNLLSGQLVEDLLRSNRMIKVIRGISARELYLSSKILSRYIRESVSSGRSSIWIAQKEGRSKDGRDMTEQGLLKMFDMSGGDDFVRNFSELNIVPLSISYEIESCDARKACELYVRERDGQYVKKENEDYHSILTGIRQNKGHIHLQVCKPLSISVIEEAAKARGNERYQILMRELDKRICDAYRLWTNNFVAYDLMTGTDRYSDRYSESDKSAFLKYADHKMSKVKTGLDKSDVRKIFIRIYGNPVLRKEELGLEI
ncbi:MAG: acyltransferase [Bacteroidales bacterium]|nr:acyltransferase [Bacteroidales bacterium]